jgi:hypothetical protein
MNHRTITDEEIKKACIGAPRWIEPRLVRKTLDIFQPRYEEQLTAEEAVGMLIRVGLLFEILSMPSKPKGKPLDQNRPNP